MRQAHREQGKVWFQSARTLPASPPRLPTGCNSLDSLLGGGIKQGFITEFYGEPSTGKTQIALKLCSSAVLSGFGALIVDSEGTFSPSRLRQMAPQGLGDRVVEETLCISNPARQPEALLHVLDDYARLRNGCLIAVDTLSGLVRQSYPPRERLLHVLSQTLRSLGSIAKFRRCFVCVFSGVRWRNTTESDAWPCSAYIAQFRVELSIGGGGIRRAVLVKSQDSEPLEALFRIGENGPVDTVEPQ
ncbi:MAG: hypothetical protein QW767_04320 [Thermoprotei archaeon]